MINKLDVFRTAHLFIIQHGDDASLHAAMKADYFLGKGDVEGHLVWMRVKRAIEELQSKERPHGLTPH